VGVDIEQETITLYDTKNEEKRAICFNENPGLKTVILGSLNWCMPFLCSFLFHPLLCGVSDPQAGNCYGGGADRSSLGLR
jgi:hypothetical protein